MNNKNLKLFAKELSNLVGQPITSQNIHANESGRFYYIQPTKKGYPMLLHHYRGPFFVDMHPDDLADLLNGKIDAIQYITNANWQIGYFWGGGSMIGGGFYQPYDIVKNKQETRRYFQILSCRGRRIASGHVPYKETCDQCFVDNCPFSKYKKGNWEDELKEFDPRVSFLEALVKRFEAEYPGYTIRGFLSSKIPDDQILVKANFHYGDDPYSFLAYASENTIRSLLIHEVEPENWDEFANKFSFMHSEIGYTSQKPVSLEQIKAIFAEIDSKNTNSQTQVVEDSIEDLPENKNFISKLLMFFKK